MRRFLQYLPIPLCGLMLAFASLGNLVKNLLSNMLSQPVAGEIFHWILGGSALILMILILLKFILDFSMCWKMLENPEIFGIGCCFFLSMMILAGYIDELFGSGPARVFWWCGFILHICAMLLFTWRYVVHFKWPQLLPPWYIVYVGFAISGFHSKDYATVLIGQIAFWFSFVCFWLLFVLLIVRIVRLGIPPMFEPTLCINAAIGICLTSYTKNFDPASSTMIFFLYFASLIIWILLIAMLYKLLKLPFYPSDAAFSFPFVVSAIASMEAMKKLMSMKIDIMSWNTPIVWVQSIVAVIMVGLCAWRFYRHITQSLSIKDESKRMSSMNMMDMARSM